LARFAQKLDSPSLLCATRPSSGAANGASCNKETPMTARKSTRTNKPKPRAVKVSETPSRVRNSEVVERRQLAAREDELQLVQPPENEPALETEPFEVASTSEPFGAAVDDEEIELARELERPPPLPRQVSRSGTLPAVADSDAFTVVEPGMPVEPEELGTQFLRNATEQDNFESQAPSDEGDNGVVILPHVVISDATLDASMQEGAEWLESSAVENKSTGVATEPFERNVDLTRDSIGAASLFDQVVPDEALSEDELEDVPVEGVTVEPTLHTEDPSDPSVFEEAREREIRRVRKELLKKRQHAEQAASPARNGK
jgi:hypothetical protein